ncbi:MAG: cell division protein FtsA [Candidatus Bipolaricaulia bacterium]
MGLAVGLDIGTTKVVALVGNVVDEETIEIIGMGKYPSKGLKRGVVVDIGETANSVRRAIEEAENMADVRIDSVYVGIAGEHIGSINNSGTVSINRDDRTIRREDVRRVIETARAVQISPANEVIHVIPREYTVDGQTGITDPVGMTGTRLEVDVHIVTGATTAVHNIVKSVEMANIGIEKIVLEPLASSEAVLSSAERELGVVMLDIGGGTTDIAIFRNDDIWHSSVIPIAGEHLTRDITVGLKTPIEEAERIKREAGSPNVEDIDSEEIVEISTIGGDEIRAIPRRKLAKVIEPRVAEIFDMAIQDVEDAGYRDLIPAGMVLTGGTSLLEGIAEFVRRRYDISVRCSKTPQGIHGLRDIVESPIFATGVGLLKFAAKEQDRYTLRVDQRRNRSERPIISRIFTWLKRFF